MQDKQTQTKPADGKSAWQSTQYSNLVRYVPSGTFFARFRVNGKLIWRSLKTDRITVAKMRLDDMVKDERTKAESGRVLAKGKVLVQDALAAYRENGFRPATPRNQKDARRLKPAALAYYEQQVVALLKSWPGFDQTEIRKLTERDFRQWADKARSGMAPSVFNHLLGFVRNVLEYGIKAGARYDNPAMGIMRESEQPKVLELPTAEQFEAFVTSVECSGARFSRPCAELVRFLAYGGFRKGEAAYVTWQDCDFDRLQITVRGHPETGLKNRHAGEMRIIPMIPEMVSLLSRLKSERPDAQPTDFVMQVRECQKAMNRAARKVGMERITHHDLRHLFATRCIESGVDIPTVARWLGHRDGGALAMRVYGHLRDAHSTAMAAKVTFKPATNILEMGPKEAVL